VAALFPAMKKKSRRGKDTVHKVAQKTKNKTTKSVMEIEAVPVVEDEPEIIADRQRKAKKMKVVAEPEAVLEVKTASPPSPSGEEPEIIADRQRKGKKKKVVSVEFVAEASPVVEEAVEEPVKATKKKRKRTSASAAAQEPASEDPAPVEEVVTAPSKKKRKKSVGAKQEETAEPRKQMERQSLDDEDQDDEETKKPDADNGRTADRNAWKVFVGGLPFNLDQDTIRRDFEECGKIKDFTLLTDAETGRSRGIAFITFEDEAGLKKALAFDGDEYGGRTIKVQKPTPSEGKGKGKGKDGKGKDKGKSNGKNNGPGEKPEGCLAVVLKGLAYSVNEQDLKDAFKKCGGGPTSVRMLNDKESGEFKGIAFLDFDNEQGVDEAIKLHGTELKGRTFKMDYSRPKQW